MIEKLSVVICTLIAVCYCTSEPTILSAGDGNFYHFDNTSSIIKVMDRTGFIVKMSPSVGFNIKSAVLHTDGRTVMVTGHGIIARIDLCTFQVINKVGCLWDGFYAVMLTDNNYGYIRRVTGSTTCIYRYKIGTLMQEGEAMCYSRSDIRYIGLLPSGFALLADVRNNAWIRLDLARMIGYESFVGCVGLPLYVDDGHIIGQHVDIEGRIILTRYSSANLQLTKVGISLNMQYVGPVVALRTDPCNAKLMNLVIATQFNLNLVRIDLEAFAMSSFSPIQLGLNSLGLLDTSLKLNVGINLGMNLGPLSICTMVGNSLFMHHRSDVLCVDASVGTFYRSGVSVKVGLEVHRAQTSCGPMRCHQHAVLNTH